MTTDPMPSPILYAAALARVAELEASPPLNPWNTAPVGEHVLVTLRTEAWRNDDGLWDWDTNGNWEIVGWQPLPPQEPTP